MTLIVGILCKDGAVIGADSASTSSSGNQNILEFGPVDKIKVVRECVVTAGTGQVGLSQRSTDTLEKLYRNQPPSGSGLDIARTMCKSMVDDCKSTSLSRIEYGCLTAYAANNNSEICLAEFIYGDFQPEMKTKQAPFGCIGSGQLYADPFLAFLWRVFFKDELPTIRQAILYTTWTLQHAINVNTGGVNGPMRIATLELSERKPVVTKLDEVDGSLQEGMTMVNDAETHLKKCLDEIGSPAVDPLPVPPS